jgi:large subunit ribosomal protein L15
MPAPILPKVRVVKGAKIREAAINLDTIDKYFDEGETVDIDTLKAKGLIHKSAGCIKVLGRGEITKPLTICAREFSNSVPQKIKSAGGTVLTAGEIAEN